MNPALLLFLQALAGLARGRDESDIAEYLELLRDLLKAGGNVNAELMNLETEIKALVAAGEDPSQEMLDTVRARRAELSASLRAGG